MNKRSISETYATKQTSSHYRLTPAIVLSVFLFMSFCSVLVCLRIYNLRLDRRSVALQYRIDKMEKVSVGFEKDIIALSAPSVIYEYASKNLGMTEGIYVGTIKVRGGDSNSVASSPEDKGWVSSMPNSSEKDVSPK